MQNTDPFTAIWLLALTVVLGTILAIPIIRAAVAIAIHAYATISGRSDARALAHRVMPRIGHLVGSIVIGVASTAAPAFAQDRVDTAGSTISVDREPALAAATPSTGPVPSVDRPASEQERTEQAPSPAGVVYVVRVGDSLWDIAQSHLDDPTDQQTTDAWKAIWKANRAVIGDHPEHITPGQVLHLDGLA